MKIVNIKSLKKCSLAVLGLCMTGCSGTVLLPGVKPVEKFDDVPPYINNSTYIFETSVNQPIDFSNITAYDDVDGLMSVEVVGKIDYSTPGTYYPQLSSTDTQGNVATQDITVIVRNYQLETPMPVVETPLPEEVVVESETCDVRGALDANRKCSDVLSEEIAGYEVIYEGEEGKALCEAKAETIDGGTCTVILRNDRSFWGYGFQVIEVQEEEESE